MEFLFYLDVFHLDFVIIFRCMTEEEKWHGKDFKAKESANSGQKKQDAWTENIQQAIATARVGNPHLSDVLQKLLGYDNVPRKEVKFKVRWPRTLPGSL